VLFASDRDGNWEIYTMKADGADVKRLTSPPGSSTAPSWAKEGTKVVFASTRDVLNGELYLMNPDGTGIERLTQDSTVKDSPAMTPDGRSVVFTVTGREGYSIAALQLSDRSILPLTPLSYNATSPRVSSDRSLVLFAATRNGYSGIYSMTLKGENLICLTPENDDCRTPAWGSSIGEIVYSKNGGLYTFSLDTQKHVKLSSKGDSAPHWIKD
jgi:TolB protein